MTIFKQFYIADKEDKKKKMGSFNKFEGLEDL